MFPRIEGFGVAKVCAVARGNRYAVSEGQCIQQAIPKRLRTPFDFGGMAQASSDASGFGIPMHDGIGVVGHKLIQLVVYL